MKAILIMDMPKDCWECGFSENGMGGLHCSAVEDSPDYVDKAANAHAIAYGCPLIPARGYVTPEGHLVTWEDDSDD